MFSYIYTIFSHSVIILVEFKIKIHIRIKKCCIRIVGVRQLAWHTKCDDEESLHFNAFFFKLVQLNAVLHIQNITEKENIIVEMLLPQN